MFCAMFYVMQSPVEAQFCFVRSCAGPPGLKFRFLKTCDRHLLRELKPKNAPVLRSTVLVPFFSHDISENMT